uniref:L1 transposable element RRM domain-containing protein n=1 Tax=Poecilia formosa TaxID=48698 RepID=A0A087X4L0_POEFO
MALKVIQKDMEELKDAMNMMSGELAILTKQQSTITDLLTEIKQLKIQTVEQAKKIDFLENRVADLEQYSRINDVLITGLDIRSSYSQAVRGSRSDINSEHEATTKEQAIAFLQSKDIDIEKENIEACHTLSVKGQRGKKVSLPIIIRFTNRKHKIELLKQGKNLKGTSVYINEHLARILKKQNKIQATWTMNCKVYIKTKDAPENARGLWIRSLD